MSHVSVSKSPSASNLVEEVWQSSTQGIPEGETLQVPVGYCAVIRAQGEVRYVLNPQSYRMTRATFPELPSMQVARGARPALKAAIYLVRTADLMLPWEQPIVGPCQWNEGATCEMVTGRYALRVINPGQLLHTVYRRLQNEQEQSGSMNSFQLWRPERDGHRYAATQLVNEANRVAMPALLDTLEAVQKEMTRLKTVIALNPQAVQAEVANRVAQRLQAHGIQLLALSIDTVMPPSPMPCSTCGTVRRPTGYACFFSNTSIMLARYAWEKRGYFCLPCALKCFLNYTAVILIAGWWGIRGMLMSPILLVCNMVNICRVLLRFRMPAP